MAEWNKSANMKFSNGQRSRFYRCGKTQINKPNLNFRVRQRMREREKRKQMENNHHRTFVCGKQQTEQFIYKKNNN